MADLALRVASSRPAVVLFLNESRAPDPRAPDGKLLQLPIRNSLSVKAMFTEKGHTDDDLGLCIRLFKIHVVDVAHTPPEVSKAVNRAKAPFVAVVGLDGKVVKVLGTLIPTRPQVMDGLALALKPKVNLRSFVERERNLIRDMMRMDILEKNLLTSQAQLAGALSGGPNAGGGLAANSKLQIAKFEKDIAALQAEIDQRRAAADAEVASLSTP